MSGKLECCNSYSMAHLFFVKLGVVPCFLGVAYWCAPFIACAVNAMGKTRQSILHYSLND